MKEIKTALTMKEVAQAAGVSTGTVDRVIHNRGRVSDETREKILSIVSRMGYKTNIGASILSVKKSFRIAIIIPYFQAGDFWSLLHKGLERGFAQFPSLKLEKKIFYYKQFECDSFVKACAECEDYCPDGIILSPIYKKESAEFVTKMHLSGVESIFVDTRVDNCPYLAYYGINLFDSAYLAADLIFSSNRNIKKIVNFNIDRNDGSESEAFSRRGLGLTEYIKDKGINCQIIPCTFSISDFNSAVESFDKFFNENPDVHYAITMTSRAHIITDWMEIRNKKDLNLTGFDNIPANVRALQRGTIRTLIAQRSDEEAFQATKAMLHFLIAKEKPAEKDNLFPIDILSKYNVKYYSSND